jgi:hypothetical protein
MEDALFLELRDITWMMLKQAMMPLAMDLLDVASQ